MLIKKNKKYGLTVLVCALFSSASFALILKGPAPQVYLFKNISKKPLLLGEVSTGQGMQAGFDSVLSAKKWSALLLNQQQFQLSCHIGRVAVNCEKVLSISRYSTKKPLPKASYWVGENQTWLELQKTLKKRLS